jgi:holin-like protein
MLGWLTVIFCCQLAGELAAKGLGLPVPGPVVGMALLFCGLLLRKGIPQDLGKVGDALIGNLSLCFVPAGVGVMLHVELIGADWLPISVALLVSTLLAIVVTALLMQWLGPRGGPAKGDVAKTSDNP